MDNFQDLILAYVVPGVEYLEKHKNSKEKKKGSNFKHLHLLQDIHHVTDCIPIKSATIQHIAIVFFQHIIKNVMC